MPRLSVLHFSNSLARGGAEEHMLILLRGLDRSRFCVFLACTPELARAIRNDLPPDVQLWPLRLRGLADLGAALRLTWLLRRHRIDILHSHLSFGSLFASPVGWLSRTPVIVETPNLNDPPPPRWRALRTRLDRVVGRCVDVHVAVAHANAAHLALHRGRSWDRIRVIHNACDLSRFDAHRPVAVGLKRGLGFEDSDPLVLSIARLQPQKGHRVLLEALARVRQEFPRVRLVCVGDGPLRPELERYAAALGLREAVRFVGYRADVPDWLGIAHLTVLASFFEGLPLAAIESLAAGCPVVATAVDGTPEVVIDGQTGLTVPAGHAGRLAEAVCRLLRDPALRQRLGAAGRRLARERFGHRRQLRETEALYEAAWAGRVRGRRRPRPAGPPPDGPADARRVDAVRGELAGCALRRVGHGFEKTVLGSPHWVVKIPRTDRGLAAAIAATAVTNRLRPMLEWWRDVRGWRPRTGGAFLRAFDGHRPEIVWVLVQAAVTAALRLVPEPLWDRSRLAARARSLRHRSEDCTALALRRLQGSVLVPARVEIAALRVRSAWWGRRRTVTDAYERVDRTLAEQIRGLARSGHYGEATEWLDRLLGVQVALWRRGVFYAVTNPLENHGVLGDRLVVLDFSGLTDDPAEIRGLLDAVRSRWAASVRGLLSPPLPAAVLAPFERRLADALQRPVLRGHWPVPDDPRWNG